VFVFWPIGWFGWFVAPDTRQKKTTTGKLSGQGFCYIHSDIQTYRHMHVYVDVDVDVLIDYIATSGMQALSKFL
jgi:hypothetical protein